MTLAMQWRMALRLLWREARSGELTLILAALLLAVTSATAISLFSSRLDLAMQARSNDLLGADLRLQSTTELPPQWQQQAQQLGLKTATTTHFSSMILAGDEMALAAVKVVSAGYPLRSKLTLENPQGGEPLMQNSGPAVGEAWAEPRLLALLNASVGDVLDVGRSQLRLSGVIAEESDRGGGFYSFSPRLMMNAADLPGSGLTDAGSRIRWRLLLVGEQTALQQFQQQLTLEPNQRWQSLEDSSEAVASRLAKARRYLGLAALLAVVLASVAVAISAQRYAMRHYDISALMRTFGLARRQVFRIYAFQLLQLGVLATATGLLLASALQAGLLAILGDLVPDPLPEAPLSAWLLGASSGLLTLLGFALPYIMPLARVTPLRVLRRDITPVPLAGWLITAVALAALTLLLWLFTGDLALSAGVMGGGSVLLLVMLVGLHGLIRVLRRQLAGRNLPLVWRFAWQHISRNSRQSAGQILAFSLTMMVMLLIGTLRTDLLADWQASMPDDAPNVFTINLQPYELEDFRTALAQHDVRPQKLYPTVPGRLLSINGEPLQGEAAEDSSVNRDLVLTADTELPASNTVVAGDWAAQQQPGQLSIEERLAGRLGVELGDVLSFRAGGVDFSATVSSIRTVDWGSMQPNFFMIFSPDVLEGLPANYLTSFYLPPGQQAALTALIRQFPAATFMDVRAILGQIQTLLEQVTLAIELILLFVLLAALLVMLASLVAALPERLREGAVLRTLGGSSALLRRSQIGEFTLLGLAAVLLALLGTELVRYVLYHTLLDIPWYSLGWIWLWLPPLAVLLLAVPGMLLLRRTTQVAPLRVLRELAE